VLTAEQIGFPLAEQGALLLRQGQGRDDELVSLVTSAEPEKLPAQKWLQYNRFAWGSKMAPINVWMFRTTMIDAASATPMGYGSWGCSGAWATASSWNGDPVSVNPNTKPRPISRW